MARKIIIDCDPGIDDAVALTMALFDPRIEVLGITATAGTIDSETATHNALAVLSALDPPRYPRVGAAGPIENAPVTSDDELHGSDGLGETNLPAVVPGHIKSSDKVIGDLAAAHPGEITLVCLGPLTNLARVCRFEPAAIELIDRIVISGGAHRVAGNATVVAERNMHFDSPAADTVFQSAITKQLVPLDVTDSVAFGASVLEELPPRHTRAGGLLHKMLGHAFRASHRQLGRETMPLYDPVTMLAVIEPEYFTWEPIAGRVETRGELTRGMTVFDTRLRRQWPENMEIATACDETEVHREILRALRYAGQQT